jgi:hypothetical protein
MKVFTVICLAAFAAAAASAEYAVIGYRTYMSSYPFYGC